MIHHNRFCCCETRPIHFQDSLYVRMLACCSDLLDRSKYPSDPIDNIDLKGGRQFLWGGSDNKHKICWVSWSCALGPKEKGGLGIGSLRSLNLSLLTKWLWRFKNQPNALWRQVVCGIHNLSRKPIHNLVKKSLTGVWSEISQVVTILESERINFNSVFGVKIMAGSNTLFWLDDWEGVACLTLDFLAFRSLTRKSHVSFRSVFSQMSSNGPGRGMLQISLLSEDGVFHVPELRCLIDSKITSPMVNPTVWFHIPPLKVICFVWRAFIDRIPTVMALSKRGVRVGANSSHLCSSGVDDTDHLFTGCSFAGDIWKWLCHWCGIPFRSFNNVSSLVKFAANWGQCPKKKRIFLVIVYGFLWCIWKARNEKVFRSTSANAPKVVDNILALVFDWVKHRGKFNNWN
ncbi:unnamed protein product [Lactuca saligna]|uniref:Reverse transcriptase zinc-binding domain-containing protein n=1 Tax=Lactuca saligna TaxID=75948 RepID=A0AA35ZX68_LACSI|nr:unnamed protein product [Lactuca saligna]